MHFLQMYIFLNLSSPPLPRPLILVSFIGSIYSWFRIIVLSMVTRVQILYVQAVRKIGCFMV